jgi:hypothetical protein
MATGDKTNIFGRFNSYLPSRWFTGSTPYKDAIATGISTVMAQEYSLYVYAKLQTRIATATDAWLDLISADYFGSTLPRISGESDASFRTRIQANLLVPRTARPAMVTVLTKLTGRAPIIFEPNNPADVGAMGVPASNGYCNHTRYGSMDCPFNALITAYRPIVSGQVTAGTGFCNAPMLTAMSTPASQSYDGSQSIQSGAVTDAAIYASINSTRPAGTVMGVMLSY